MGDIAATRRAGLTIHLPRKYVELGHSMAVKQQPRYNPKAQPSDAHENQIHKIHQAATTVGLMRTQPPALTSSPLPKDINSCVPKSRIFFPSIRVEQERAGARIDAALDVSDLGPTGDLAYKGRLEVELERGVPGIGG